MEIPPAGAVIVPVAGVVTGKFVPLVCVLVPVVAGSPPPAPVPVVPAPKPVPTVPKPPDPVGVPLAVEVPVKSNGDVDGDVSVLVPVSLGPDDDIISPFKSLVIESPEAYVYVVLPSGSVDVLTIGFPDDPATLPPIGFPSPV